MNIALIKFPRQYLPFNLNSSQIPLHTNKEKAVIWVSPCDCYGFIAREKKGVCPLCGYAIMDQKEKELFDKILDNHTIVPFPNIFGWL